jgi:hypothetical protein
MFGRYARAHSVDSFGAKRSRNERNRRGWLTSRSRQRRAKSILARRHTPTMTRARRGAAYGSRAADDADDADCGGQHFERTL